MHEGEAIVLIFLMAFGLAGFVRYLRYRETLMLAEKGLVKPRRSNGRDLLTWGAVITALGIALLLGLYPIGWMTGDEFPLHFGPWMLLGLAPTFVGLALLLVYAATRTHEPPEPAGWEPMPRSGTPSGPPPSPRELGLAEAED
jgi:hypothetical protein